MQQLSTNLDGHQIGTLVDARGGCPRSTFAECLEPNARGRARTRAKCTWARQDSSQTLIFGPKLERDAHFSAKTRARRSFFGQNSSETFIFRPKLERDAHPRAVTRL